MNTIRPYLIKAVDPQHLLEQVNSALNNNHDMISPTFGSYDGRLCQWMAPVVSLYEYRLIATTNVEALETRAREWIAELDFDFFHHTVMWNSLYLQWMCRTKINIDELKAKWQEVSQRGVLTLAERKDELQLVEDVRSYLHLAPMGENAQLVTIPFPVNIS